MDGFHRETGVNVLRTVLTARETIPYLRESGGIIAFLSGIAGKYDFRKFPVYAASKW